MRVILHAKPALDCVWTKSYSQDTNLQKQARFHYRNLSIILQKLHGMRVSPVPGQISGPFQEPMQYLSVGMYLDMAWWSCWVGAVVNLHGLVVIQLEMTRRRQTKFV